MSVHQRTLNIATPGRGLTDITQAVRDAVRDSAKTGIVHIFVMHTSASLLIQENADPKVLVDLNHWFDTHVPDGDPVYTHRDEGPDDMPAHIRAALTESSLTVPLSEGSLMLGTWQGLMLFEHRHGPHNRRVVVTIMGE